MRKPRGPMEVLDWSSADRDLRGPYRAPEATAGSPFEVVETEHEGVQFGRLTSGIGWPDFLPPIDRFAAVPQVREHALPTVRPGETVLRFEPEGHSARAICTRGEHTRWWVNPLLWVRMLLRERYVPSWRRPLPSRLPILNYARAPHRLKKFLEPLASPRRKSANRIAFPMAPLDDLVDVVRRLCFALAFGSEPQVGQLWPGGRRAAVTLTHDVDTGWILDPRRESVLRRILDAEAGLGYRGAWYVTADRVRARHRDGALAMVLANGHEVGSHGWKHDARLDFLSEARQEARIERILAAFEGLPIAGIRTPWYARSPRLQAVLSRHFCYDSSVPNTSGLFSHGSDSGCCTIFPYRLASGLWEIPMTLPPDTALPWAQGWASIELVADRIVESGGVVVVTLHTQPHQSANDTALPGYFAFLERLTQRHGDTLWHATPAQITKRYAALTDTTVDAAFTQPG